LEDINPLNYEEEGQAKVKAKPTLNMMRNFGLV